MSPAEEAPREQAPLLEVLEAQPREATEEELRAQRAGYARAEMGTDADEDRERMAAQASEISHDLAREIYKVIHKHSPEFIEHGDEEVEEIERLI